MLKRTPIKGEPDFTAISDEKLVSYLEVVQSMIFAYQGCDAEATALLHKLWKQLSCEQADRQVNSINEFIAEESEPIKTVKIKTVKIAKRIKC